MNKFTSVLIFSLFGTLLIFWACKHPLPEPITGGSQIPGQTGRDCDTDSVYFANEILPLLKSNCAMAGCHDDITRKEGVQITSYNTIMSLVVPNNGTGSKLYRVMTKTGGERMPPAPYPALTSAQIARIVKWINQGAQNNACDKCDTIDFKFSTAVLPILSIKCKGCHNPASLGGGIDLTSYTGAKTVALNGKLYGSINWAAGYKNMPQGSVKLPPCEITQIKKWIDAGALNN